MEVGPRVEDGDKREEEPREGGLAATTSVSAATQAISNTKELEKLAQIAEVMELLEETHKGKDWLLEQIRQNRIKAVLRPTMSIVGILKACPVNFISHLLDI